MFDGCCYRACHLFRNRSKSIPVGREKETTTRNERYTREPRAPEARESRYRSKPKSKVRAKVSRCSRKENALAGSTGELYALGDRSVKVPGHKVAHEPRPTRYLCTHVYRVFQNCDLRQLGDGERGKERRSLLLVAKSLESSLVNKERQV